MPIGVKIHIYQVSFEQLLNQSCIARPFYFIIKWEKGVTRLCETQLAIYGMYVTMYIIQLKLMSGRIFNTCDKFTSADKTTGNDYKSK